MRRARWFFSIGCFLLLLGGCFVNTQSAGLLVAFGFLLMLGAVNSFLGGLRDNRE